MAVSARWKLAMAFGRAVITVAGDTGVWRIFFNGKIAVRMNFFRLMAFPAIWLLPAGMGRCEFGVFLRC